MPRKDKIHDAVKNALIKDGCVDLEHEEVIEWIN